MTIKGIVPITLANGNVIKMYSNSDDFVLKELYFGLNDEKGTEKIMKLAAERSAVIFDIGANTGLFSISCSGYNPHARIFSFEPVEQIADRFDKNISINHLSNIEVIRKLVSDKVQEDMTLFVPNSEISYSASTFKDFHDPETITPTKVEATTIDDFKRERSLPKIDFIKVDVEWHEFEVLLGAMDVLKNDSPLLIIEILFSSLEVRKNAQLAGKLPQDHHLNIQKLLTDLGYYSYMINALGIYRVDQLEPNANERNYLFSKKQSERHFISFNESDLIVDQVFNNV